MRKHRLSLEPAEAALNAVADAPEAPSTPTSQQLEMALEVEHHEIPLHVDNWDEYFICVATAVSIKSKDPKCAVGAVIVSDEHEVISTGFNGLARGVYDDAALLANADEKLKIICHAEHNAILNAARLGGRSLKGASIYVTKFPCVACCNSIIQAGITRIYTHDDRFWGDDPFDSEHVRKKDILHQAGINVVAPFHPAYNPKRRFPNKKPNSKAGSPAVQPKTRSR